MGDDKEKDMDINDAVTMCISVSGIRKSNLFDYSLSFFKGGAFISLSIN